MTETLHKIAILPRHPILVIRSYSINIKEEPGGDFSENKKSGDCDA